MCNVHGLFEALAPKAAIGHPAQKQPRPWTLTQTILINACRAASTASYCILVLRAFASPSLGLGHRLDDMFVCFWVQGRVLVQCSPAWTSG